MKNSTSFREAEKQAGGFQTTSTGNRFTAERWGARPISDQDHVTFAPISGCEFIMIASINVIRHKSEHEHPARTQAREAIELQ